MTRYYPWFQHHIYGWKLYQDSIQHTCKLFDEHDAFKSGLLAVLNVKSPFTPECIWLDCLLGIDRSSEDESKHTPGGVHGSCWWSSMSKPLKVTWKETNERLINELKIRDFFSNSRTTSSNDRYSKKLELVLLNTTQKNCNWLMLLEVLKELGPILLTFFKLFEILIPKCCPHFSHNPCEILHPKHV